MDYKTWHKDAVETLRKYNIAAERVGVNKYTGEVTVTINGDNGQIYIADNGDIAGVNWPSLGTVSAAEAAEFAERLSDAIYGLQHPHGRGAVEVIRADYAKIDN